MGRSLKMAWRNMWRNWRRSTTMYARFVPSTILSLSISTLVIVLLASLYPAWFAARLQPVEALHES